MSTNNITLTTYIKFFVVAMFIGCLFIVSGSLGEFYDIGLKILLIILLCVYGLKQDDFKSIFNINFPPGYLLVIIIPLIFSVLLSMCPIDFMPYPSFIIMTVVGTLTTAIWEELYFRYVGCSLFEENGKFKWYNILFLTLVFSCTHIVNIFGQSLNTTLTQLLFTIGLGVFLLALYIDTRSIILPIIAHFCINSVADFFNLFATPEAQAMAYFSGSVPLLLVYVIVFIAIGVYILKRHDNLC